MTTVERCQVTSAVFSQGASVSLIPVERLSVSWLLLLWPSQLQTQQLWLPQPWQLPLQPWKHPSWQLLWLQSRLHVQHLPWQLPQQLSVHPSRLLPWLLPVATIWIYVFPTRRNHA